MAILHTFDKKLIRQYMLASPEILQRGTEWAMRTENFSPELAKEWAITVAEEKCYNIWKHSVERNGYETNELRAWCKFREDVKSEYYFETAEHAAEGERKEKERKEKISKFFSGQVMSFFVACIFIGIVNVCIALAPDLLMPEGVISESMTVASIATGIIFMVVGVIGLVIYNKKRKKK